MHLMVKPNGIEVKVNSNSLEYALSLGWKEKKSAKKVTTQSSKTKGKTGDE